MNNSQKKVVLVVEDEISYRNALAKKLSQEGFIVLGARNGEQGLSLALARRPDIILLDILMPEMDGIVMMRKVRSENEWGKNVPIILLTNLNSPGGFMTDEIKNNQPVEYLVKSDTKIEDLVKKIREMI